MYSSPGGMAGTLWKGTSLGSDIVFTNTLTQTNGNFGVTAAGTVTCGASVSYTWGGRSRMFSPADGNILLQNNAQTGFNLLQFGGTSVSFSAIKSSGTFFSFRSADDANYVDILAKSIVSSGGPIVAAANAVAWGGTTGTTVGAAGAAAALPATPTGYININVAGTAQKIPYYN
jgi:hypothetical protein